MGAVQLLASSVQLVLRGIHTIADKALLVAYGYISVDLKEKHATAAVSSFFAFGSRPSILG